MVVITKFWIKTGIFETDRKYNQNDWQQTLQILLEKPDIPNKNVKNVFSFIFQQEALCLMLFQIVVLFFFV